MCWLSITTGGRGWLCSNGHICSASQGLTLAARPHLPQNGGLHHLPRTHTQRHAPAFHQTLFHRRQARGLQNRCGHIPKRLRPRRERRHGRAERLPDAYHADRKTTRGLLPQAGHAAGSAHDEGRDGRAREHARGLQHHHQGVGRPSVPDGWIQRPKRNAVPGTPPGPPVQWDKAEDPDDVQPGYGYVPADTTHHEDIFFYHTDHLGSTSYVTDAKANITQFDAYLPYGELLVDEHSSTEEMPYKFNGKEFDEETGLYYYGARYMNPKTSLWYGVDPLAKKYPSVSGYVFCMDNPIRLIDPNGKAVKPEGDLAMSIIKNTLPKDTWQYITLDKNGYIDSETMNQYKGDSENFMSLKTLVESPEDIKVSTLTQTNYVRNGEKETEYFNPISVHEDFFDTNFTSCSGNTVGEYGNLGVTYMPTNGEVGKADAENPNSIRININPSLSPVGAAETFSHEGYGHALIYVESGGDRYRAVHHFQNSHETNQELIDKSIKARKETIKNMK